MPPGSAVGIGSTPATGAVFDGGGPARGRLLVSPLTTAGMVISESDLPGVGKKFEVDLGDGSMVIVVHNTGKREVFRRPAPGADSERVFELPDGLARKVGTILEGAYFQPVGGGDREATLPGGLLLEWYELPPGSPLAGETIGSAGIGATSGATVVAVQRGETVVNSPTAETELREGDTLVVIGTDQQCAALETLLADE